MSTYSSARDMQDDFRMSTVRGELFRHPGTCYRVIQTRQMVQPSQPRAQSLCDRLVREMTTSLRLLVDCRRIVENLSHNPTLHPGSSVFQTSHPRRTVSTPPSVLSGPRIRNSFSFSVLPKNYTLKVSSTETKCVLRESFELLCDTRTLRPATMTLVSKV